MAPDLLVLVKHARPEVDPTRPAAEWTLGVDGFEGSRRLAERLRPVGLDLVVSSVEPKAAETGRIVADGLGLTWQTGHDLHEHVRQTARYLSQAMFEASIRRFFDSPSAVVFGEESADAAFNRFSTAVDVLVKAHAGRRLAVVAHGTVIALLLSRRYGVDAFATWKALDLPSYVVVDRRSKTVVDVVVSV